MLNQIDLSRTDLNLLVLYEVVLDERHVGRAADRLNLSPSAVSHGLNRLRRLLNDPLFLRTPKGVVPTERALALAEPIAEALAQVRGILSRAEPFDPATSRRRFVLAAPDGVSAVLLPPLLEALRQEAPGVDVGVRQLLPVAGETALTRAWRGAFADLEDRRADVAIIPSGDAPARFHLWPVLEEDFVIAARRGHPFATAPSLALYGELDHVMVSATADPSGFVDEILRAEGRSRRVALTVPDSLFALAIVAETDFLCALPRRLVRRHGPRFDIVGIETPFPLSPFRMSGVVLKSALGDLGLAWLMDRLQAAGSAPGRG